VRSVNRRSLIILRSCSVSSVPYLQPAPKSLHYCMYIHKTSNLCPYFSFRWKQSITLIWYHLTSGH